MSDRGPHGSLPAPPDHRPYRRQSADGAERAVYRTEANGEVWRETHRKIGWHGQSGAFYALDEHPKDHEPGSWTALWFIAFTDRVEAPEPDELIGEAG